MRKKLYLLIAIMLLCLSTLVGCSSEPEHTLEHLETEVKKIPFNGELIDCVCVYTTYTNASEETVIPADYVDVDTFQNGTELNILVFTGQMMDGFYQCDTKVQSGNTANLIWVYELQDTSAPIDIDMHDGTERTLQGYDVEEADIVQMGGEVIGSASACIDLWKTSKVTSNFEGIKQYGTFEIELCEDGSCRYNDMPGTWEYLTDTNQVVITLQGSEEKLALDCTETDGKATLTFFEDVYYRESEFVPKENDSEEDEDVNSVSVDITMDNWDTYFELVETSDWRENAFGEVDNLNVFWNIVLKREWFDKVDFNKEFKVAFEVKAKSKLVGLDVDYLNKTYNYREDLYSNEESNEDTTAAMEYWYIYEENGVKVAEPLHIWSSGVGEYEMDSGEKIADIYRYYDNSITRVEGAIWIKE